MNKTIDEMYDICAEIAEVTAWSISAVAGIYSYEAKGLLKAVIKLLETALEDEEEEQEND